MLMKQLNKFREPDHIFPAILSAREQDVFALLLCEISKAQAKQKKNDVDGINSSLPNVFIFSEEELMSAFNCSKDNIRKILEPAAKSLQEKRVGYSDKNGFDYFSPVGRVAYQRGKEFRLEMLPSVVDMISEYEGFSELDFKLFASLNGRYEKRILRELSRWKDIPDKKIKFSIDELRRRLGVEDDKYQRMDAFKARCIDQPMKAILSSAKGVWTATDVDKKGYELIKSGRTYNYIIFHMKYTSPTALNKKTSKQLSIDDAIKTYSDLMNKERLPSTAELNNLMSFMGQLILEGFEFGAEFLTLFKTAQDANSQLDGE